VGIAAFFMITSILLAWLSGREASLMRGAEVNQQRVIPSEEQASADVKQDSKEEQSLEDSDREEK
jgi:hypothetical protein